MEQAPREIILAEEYFLQQILHSPFPASAGIYLVVQSVVLDHKIA